MEENPEKRKKTWLTVAFSLGVAASLLFLFLLFLFLMVKNSKEDPYDSHDHEAETPSGPRANSPPRGWNSYDSFSWTIDEEQFLSNARVLSNTFSKFGYQYAVVDFLWYRKMVAHSSVWASGLDVIDEWGRPIPDPARWPSSRGGYGFKNVASQIHQMGLKFGIHVMRGISTQAINANTPIMDSNGEAYRSGGRIWRARDIALTKKPCGWMPACFTSIDTSSGAGLAFLQSLYQLYDEWGVDFVKHDCVFGDDFNEDEIKAISEILKEKDRPIVYSISPGTHVTPAMAEKVKDFVNMYRVTGDDWDTWSDFSTHFDVARDFAQGGFIGSRGLEDSNQGPHRNSSLTVDEQKAQMTLWAMAKSPLFLGGDLRNLDSTTLYITTNAAILEIHNTSSHNRELSNIQIKDLRIWGANGTTGEVYIAVFNLGSSEKLVTVKFEDVIRDFIHQELRGGGGEEICTGFDIWERKELGEINDTLSFSITKHGCVALVLKCTPEAAERPI
ncbi:alpha-galactosidase isoform X2 [Amborella trichopoda]|uniref:alpha-galactosidase isoform X2 n=1 Tax=Amborella trichopoda TaxID=13333 RepID=UPI0009C0C0E8|nr:alpha-galactosidase isoform X2 [Amborella trichopoda]|eukprot:XP_020527618.1 alpha-galactosidase isoform X2 [Amborella trichopoda]